MQMDAPDSPTAGSVSTETPSNDAALVGIILGITLLIYLRTLSFDFVYDDLSQIVGNESVKSWRFVPLYFRTHVWEYLYPGVGGSSFYRPLFLLFCLLNHSLFGLRPMAWHASAVLLHLAATALTFLAIRKLTANRLTAALTALLFGVHPIHVEAVAWVSGVTESLFAVPFLGAFLAYLQSREGNAKRWTAVSLLLYAASLLCKETAIVLPILVLAHAWIYYAGEEPRTAQDQRLRAWNAARNAAPYLPVLVAYLGVRVAVLKGIGNFVTPLPISTILLTWPSLLLIYLRQLVFPVGLSLFYDVPYVKRFDVAHVLAPVLLILLVVAAVWYWQRRSDSREVELASVWIVAPLLPLLNLSYLQELEFVHDRYLYLPSIGFALLAALALQKLPTGGKFLYRFPSSLVIAAGVLTAVLCLGTVLQTAPWRDELALYSHIVRIAPHNWTARNNLARVYTKLGRQQEAIALYLQILRENPNFWLANYNLGYHSYRTGKLDDAEKYLVHATQINPFEPDQYLFLGLTRLRLGRTGDAAADLSRAIALRPYGRGYHFALGMILKQEGNCPAARGEFQAELAIDSRNPLVRQELAKCESVISGR